MEKALNSAMVEERMSEIVARKNEIVDEVEAKKEEFESADTDKRDELLNEVEALTEEANKIDEEVKDLEEQRSTLKAQEERMSMAQTLSKTAIEERKTQMENNNNVLASKEYNQLYADMIRGKVDEKEVRSFLEARALTTATSNVPVPTIMEGFVETAWYEYGKFSRLVSETFDPAILKIPVEVSADGAVWHTEGDDAPAEETITLGQIILQPKMIKKWISLTDELMAMSADEFLRYISDELVYKVVLALDEAIINRSDANGLGVIGITSSANASMVESSNVTALAFNTILSAISNLVTFDDLTIAMNPATFFNGFMGLTDLQGLPIFRITQDNNAKPQYYLNGYRVEFTQALKSFDSASANDPVIVVGDFRRGYRLNYPQGKNVITLVDPYTLATEDLVRMIGRLYVAGNVVKPKHFSVIKKVSA